MRFIVSLFCALALLMTTSQEISAQHIDAGGWIGATYYFGDLNPKMKFDRPGPGLGVSGRLNFNPRLAAKLSLSYGRVSADDGESDEIYLRTRNLSFFSNIIEGTAQFEFNFFKYDHYEHMSTPYVFVGVSVTHFNPKAKYEGSVYELNPLGTEGQRPGDEYFLTVPAFAYGGGYKFDISPVLSINLELSGRLLFTDYLDDVSTVYPDMDNLESLRGQIAVDLSDRSVYQDGQIGEPGRQRGDSLTRDSYGFIQIGLVYNFFDVKCFRF